MRRLTLQFLCAFLLAFAVANFITTVHDLIRFYVNMPEWDPLDYLTHLAGYQRFDLSVFWIQHNEHREIGTELLYAIDMLFFHERQILPTLAGIAAYIGGLWIFIAFAWKEVSDTWAMRSAVLLAIVLAAYKICAVSLAIPFLTSWPQWEFFGTAALAAAVLHQQRGGMRMVVLAICLAVAATYSMSNGMLVWPLLVATGLLLHYTWKEIASIACIGALASGLYFYHYQNLHTFGITAFVHHPGYAFGFLGSFLGMPFSAGYHYHRPWKASIHGWLALVVLATDGYYIWRKHMLRSPTVLVLGGYCLLALMSATLTSIGRMNPEEPHYIAARAGRYITEPILFWCALILLTVWVMQNEWEGKASFYFLFGMAAMMAIVLPTTKPYYDWWVNYFARGQWAEIAMENGVVDGAVADVFYSNRDYVFKYQHVLYENRLGGFNSVEPGWIGQPIYDLFQKQGSGGEIHGAVTTVQKRDHGYEVQGWADGASTFVFADDAGRVLGFGKRPAAGPAELYTHDLPPTLAFTGFIRGNFGARQFSVWALDVKHGIRFRMGQLQNQLPQ